MLFGPQSEAGPLVYDKSARAKGVGAEVVMTTKRRGKTGGPSSAYEATGKGRKNRTPKKRLEDTRCIYPAVWASLKYKSTESKKDRPAFLSASQSKQPVCVTGADGFVAAWIVAELLQRGYKVRATVPMRTDDLERLKELPKASKNLSIVETSLLTPELCDLAVEGCEYVIHTGTPASCTVRDPVSEAKDPGLHTISSRIHCIVPVMINFMKACVRAKVKKIILTSSIAALCDRVSPTTIVNDLCWNTESTLEKNPHFLGLKLAEEKAWQLVEQESMELVTICPGTLMGPSICGSSIPPGNQVVYDLITGAYAALVDLNWSVTDVRDCALAHVLAMEHPDARGRYICVNRTVWLRDIVETLRANGYSGRDLPLQVGLPNWVARLPAYAPQLGQVGCALYADHPSNAQPSPYLSDRIVDVMGLTFRDARGTVVETAGDLLKWKWIKPWAEDCEALECAICAVPFSFIRRKHHCRECGTIICADCSLSRAVVEGLAERARLCDQCVQTSIPALIELLPTPHARTAVVALESLMENPDNHELITRCHGIPLLLQALHSGDEDVSRPAAGTFLALSLDVASALQMVLEGAVLHMLEVDQTTDTWRQCLQALRNIWRQINRAEFRKMLHSVSRVSADAASGPLKANILLTFVHMMEPAEVAELLKEGLMDVLSYMLQSAEAYPRCAAAHAIMRLIPDAYNPDTTIVVPSFNVDNHEELLTLSALSDIQFLVKGHIAPINAHKIVLFVRNAYFKNMFGSTTTTKRVIEIDNCSYNVFSMLLRFLYTGKLTIDEGTAQELLRAASFYQVTALQKRIELFLADRIEIGNVVELLNLSNDCHAESLRQACIPFLMKNIHAVVKLPSFARHHDWVNQEILLELANILGPVWYAAYLEVIKHKAAKATTAPVVSVVIPPKATPPVPSPVLRPKVVSPAPRSRLLSDESIAEGIC
ncbi:dihydroflavonol-4-reductase [Achlya hypogyna]|uniref:Dihydroflavonol-4-reductase n=1 Tax=Achlya hypogyna TaxID=1202772 RepID=A0A1V9YGM6_ACHHY|nr:dihydroflavonol-4-reductase [Achlya hypogyna]